MKRFFKIAGLTIAGILILLTLLLFLLSSGSFNQWISKTICSTANKELNAELCIGNIEGNPLSHIRISQVEISQNKQKVIAIQELEIGYNIWKIFAKKLEFTHVKINGTSLFLKQNADELWNIQTLMPTSENSDTITSTQEFSWKIELADAQINQFEAKVESQDSSQLIPQNVKFDAAFQFALAANQSNFKIHKFELSTQKPDFHLKHFQVDASLIDSVLSWSDLQVQLPKSLVISKGTLPLNHPEKSELSLHANPFSFEDIHAWLPSIYGDAKLDMEIARKNEANQLDFSMQQDNQRITLLGEITEQEPLPSFHFSLKVDSLNGEYWTHNTDLKSNIKGSFELSGEGFDFAKNSLKAKANFTDLKYQDYSVDDFILHFEKDKSQFNANLIANTIFGKFNSKIQIDSLSELGNYQAELNIRKLDLSKLSTNKNLKSNLNFDLQALGQGFTPGELQTKISLRSQKSSLFNQPINKLNADLFLTKKVYQINQFHFEAPYFQVNITGKGNFPQSNLLQVKMKSKNISKVLVTLGMKPADLDGEITADLSGPSQSLDFLSNISITNAKIDSLSLTNAKLKLQSHFSWNDVLTSLDSIDNKTAIDPLFQNIALKAEAKVDYASYQKFYLTDVNVKAEKKRETINGQISSSGIFGNLGSNFSIQNLFSIPAYQVESNLQSTDLYRITGNEKLRSDLNLEIVAQGQGIEPESMVSNVQIRSNESSIFGLPVKNLNAKINYNKGNYQIEGFHIETPFALADIMGEGKWTTNNTVKLEVKTTDIEQLNSALGIDNLQVDAHLNAEMKGPADSLQVFTSLQIDHLQMDSLKIEKIQADANIQFVDTNYSGSLHLQLKESKIQNFNLQDLQFTSTFDQHKASNLFTFFASDSLQASLASEILLEKNPLLSFPDIHLNLNHQIWTSANTSNSIRFYQDSIEIHQMEIHSSQSKLKANGMFAFRGPENLQLEIENLNLIPFSKLELLAYSFSGILTANLDLSGTASQPNIQGRIKIDQPELNKLKFHVFQSNFTYSENQLHFKTNLDDYQSTLLKAELELPLHFSFTETPNLLQEDQPIHATFNLQPIDVDKLNGFLPSDIHAKGLLSAQIKLDNTIRNPHMTGQLDFSEGTFTYQPLGANYKKIEFHSRLDQKHIYLDSLHMNAGKGYLKLKANAELQSLASGKLKNIQMNLNGQNFKAFDSDMLKAVFSTKLNLYSSTQKSSFDGKMTLLSSNLDTDLFLKEVDRYYDDTSEPLLVSARKKAEKVDLKFELKQDSSTNFTSDFYKNLKGHFDIEVPRNTWVKGKNMNFELAGNLRLIKESDQFDILGSLNVKRGYYKIYGRKLEVEEGEITLTGGSFLNPIVNFKIAYSFRDSDNELQTLNGNVTGRISEPDVSFTLDDESIEEKDAISYLIFNKSTSQLNTGESTSMKSSNIDLAKDFAIGQFSTLMKDALQSSLGLDVVEISGEDGWSQGNVSVGKYITNNLYLNYERSFAIDKKDKVVEPETILLEYQFYRSLFLQATNQSSNSGFDFILKWTWK
jgi:hypothetical protein